MILYTEIILIQNRNRNLFTKFSLFSHKSHLKKFYGFGFYFYSTKIILKLQ